VVNTNESRTPKLSRREMVERLLSGMAAGIMCPLLASAHPIHEHLRSGATLDLAADLSAASDWTPLFLDVRQNAALVSLAECVVPGSTAAQVNRFIDLLLSVETADNQQKFISSLASIEKAANERFGRGLASLNFEDLQALLTVVSTADASQTDFNNLKEWISGAYYSSEQGMRELGWDGNYVFAAYPGCASANGTT
jgi:gluconate 2-dehydrogenase subunit 3-like protein